MSVSKPKSEIPQVLDQLVSPVVIKIKPLMTISLTKSFRKNYTHRTEEKLKHQRRCGRRFAAAEAPPVFPAKHHVSTHVHLHAHLSHHHLILPLLATRGHYHHATASLREGTSTRNSLMVGGEKVDEELDPGPAYVRAAHMEDVPKAVWELKIWRLCKICSKVTRYYFGS